jgi:hypothetical protein
MKQDMVWAALLHLGYNFVWEEGTGRDETSPFLADKPKSYAHYTPVLELDESLWADLSGLATRRGVNAFVIDLLDGVRYESHPEIAVEGAWSTARLREELARLHEAGIEPLPKLNLSAAHDVWLKDYSRMVGSRIYRQVVTEIIDEICGLFDGPRYFHLGLDEETSANQEGFAHSVVRRGHVWWNDALHFISAVEKHGGRAWVWADRIWHHPEEYLDKMPRSVVQSNWHYSDVFSGCDEEDLPRILTETADGFPAGYLGYLELAAGGFDQIPASSSMPPWDAFDGIGLTADFMAERTDPSRVLGFLDTNWIPLIEENRAILTHSFQRIGEARGRWEARFPNAQS